MHVFLLIRDPRFANSFELSVACNFSILKLSRFWRFFRFDYPLYPAYGNQGYGNIPVAAAPVNYPAQPTYGAVPQQGWFCFKDFQIIFYLT